MKKIAGNLSFKHINVEILCTEIMADIIDEIRRERKIAMSIKDASQIKEYISQDLDEVNQFRIREYNEWEYEKMIREVDKLKFSETLKKIIHDKDMFRKDMTQHLAIIKLTYMFDTIKRMPIHQSQQGKKPSILDPGRFKEKKDNLDQREKRIKEKGLLEIGLIGENGSVGAGFDMKFSQRGLEEEHDSDDLGEQEIEIEVDPMLKHITGVFDKLKTEIDRVGARNKQLNNKHSQVWSSSNQSSIKKSQKSKNMEKGLKSDLNSPSQIFLSPRKTKLFRKLQSRRKSEQLDTVEEALKHIEENSAANSSPTKVKDNSKPHRIKDTL